MDTALIDKKLAFMETCVRELKELARPERMADDVREARFVEHTLQLAIQAALDVASHIVSARRLVPVVAELPAQPALRNQPSAVHARADTVPSPASTAE